VTFFDTEDHVGSGMIEWFDTYMMMFDSHRFEFIEVALPGRLRLFRMWIGDAYVGFGTCVLGATISMLRLERAMGELRFHSINLGVPYGEGRWCGGAAPPQN
jgi:hypothetical protein